VVNASLNWASIVGIVLAVGGAFLYFMRSFRPALARDYDVFFAAVGLLCGGILFFQGWRLDPILQFGQFLLAGTTVFFAYESVRLRGVTTEQARRSSYFDDDEPLPERDRMGGSEWAGGPDRLDEPQPLRRRIRSRETVPPDDDEFYRPSRSPERTAIPERAASRRSRNDEDWNAEPAPAAGGRPDPYPPSPRASRFRDSASAANSKPSFGERRRDREAPSEIRRGSRPVASSESMPRSSRRGPGAAPSGSAMPASPGVPQGTPIRGGASRSGSVTDADYKPMSPSSAGRSSAPGRSAPPVPDPAAARSSRDNSSRFDD